MMINYKNILGQKISLQQFNQLEEYILETIDDSTGELKIIETFRKGRQLNTKSFDYFLNSNEDKDSVIQQYMEQDLFKGISVFLNKTNVLGFKSWDVENYNQEGILKSKNKQIFDSSNRLVFYGSINLQTNEIDSFHNPSKYYYGNQNDMLYLQSIMNGYTDIPDLKLEFYYKFNQQTNQFDTYIIDLNGSLDEIHTMNVAEFVDLIGEDFWDAHPYYHSLYPLMPTSANI